MSDLADARARSRIGPWAEEKLPDLQSFEPDTSFVVRAAAGSGKTTALVARMTALVRTGVPVDRIAAITFTRKAAGEMSRRFFEELERTRPLLERAGRTEELERVDRARERLGRCFIGTIHAFCARLLRERPLEAGVPPDFSAGVDEREEERVRRASWQRYLATVARDRPEALDRLESLGVDPTDLFDLFSDLARFEELEPWTDGPDTPPDLEPAVAEAERVLDEWVDRRPDRIPEGQDPDPVMQALDKARTMRRHGELDRPARRAEFLELFEGVVRNGSARVTLKRWGESGSDAYAAARTLRDEVLPGLVESIRPDLIAWRAYLHRELVEFTEPAVETYARRRRREGQLTFHDLLLTARDLLREHPNVRAYFQERYRYLLVDEFQDTDPVQAEVLFFLTGANRNEREWQHCRPRPGSLFIVGDDKQSIYRFRRADLEVFDRVAGLVDGAGGEEVELTTNFRSDAAICTWCDRAFGALFARDELRPYQAEYTPFTPAKDGSDPTRHLRRITTGKVRRNRGEEIARREAARIAGFIARALDGDLADRELPLDGRADPDEFLILTRTKKRLPVYAEALAKRGIPYTVTGGGDLGASDELRVLVDLMTAAERPDDPVARVAVLRGALVGLSDADLYRYRRVGGSFTDVPPPLDSAIEDELDPELVRRLERAFGQLERARRLLEEEPPAVAVGRLLDELGLVAASAHPRRREESGSLRAGRLVRALSVVRRLEIDGLHWTEIREELDRVLDGDRTIDGMTLETGTGRAVRLMNLHQAKGLEADVVFLADPYAPGSSPGPSRYVERSEGRIVLPVVRRFGEHMRTEIAAPLAWEETYREEEERYDAAEEQRLQYVAATRARRLLVVSQYEPKPQSGSWADLYPYLDETGVPELEESSELESDAPAVPAPDLAEARRRRTDRIEAAGRAGYRVGSVTGDLAPEDRRRSQEGYGRAFGEAVHLLLAAAARGTIVSDRQGLRRILEDHDLHDPSEEQVEAAGAMLDRFRRSPLRERVHRADLVRTEVPVTGLRRPAPEAEDTGGESPATERTSTRSTGRTEGDGTVEQLQRGVVDLAYRDERGWHLVDYKTDRYETASERSVLVERYAPQVRTYVRIWEEVGGEPVVSGSLWFAERGESVRVAD